MKLAAPLLIAALVAPAALALGLSAAVVATATTGLAIGSIALGDYGKATCTYARPAVRVRPHERLPLAA